MYLIFKSTLMCIVVFAANAVVQYFAISSWLKKKCKYILKKDVSPTL